MSEPRRAVAATRDGVTLIELLVVLAILGLTTGIAGLALRTDRHESDSDARTMARVRSLRHEAVVAGHDVSTTVTLGERPYAVTAFPDGRVLADSLPALDPLTGRLAAEGWRDAR